MTSNDIDSKYLLRSDQKVLDQQGHNDLKELGLIPEDRQTDQNTGQMVLTAVKKYFRSTEEGGSNTDQQA